MSPKFLFVVVGLLVLGGIEARDLLKKFHDKEPSLISFAAKSGEKVGNLVRKRRSADEDKEDSSAEPTSDEAAALVKFFVNVAWQSDKKDLLGGFLEEMTDSDTNITLVGWQRVLDGEGKVKEIRTVEFVIPPKPKDTWPQKIVEDDSEEEEYLDQDDNERIIPYGTINELKEIFDPMASIGIPATVTFEQFEKDGDLEGLIYMAKDELFISAEGFSIYNKTSISTPQEVADFVKSLKSAALGKPSVLKYDVDGNLLVDQSNIRPHLLGTVSQEHDAPENVLIESPQIIAQISQQFPQEQIPKELASYYNKHFPEFRWRVLVDPSNYHVTRDVSVTLSYDNFDLDENSYITYLVYGVKKSSNK